MTWRRSNDKPLKIFQNATVTVTLRGEGRLWHHSIVGIWNAPNRRPNCNCRHTMVNSLRPRQNRRHFADDIFKCIFQNENEWVSLRISLKFVPKVRINNIPSLVQVMAWRRPGDKPYLNQCWLDHWRIYASLGLNELTLLITVNDLPLMGMLTGYVTKMLLTVFH